MKITLLISIKQYGLKMTKNKTLLSKNLNFVSLSINNKKHYDEKNFSIKNYKLSRNFVSKVKK